ncbi:sodium:solute symporter [Gluconacetobacter sacchari]|uniref:sodium:solute symporter n=1 Tax=Gluconacetobacter sacchari TaxID=92759 RepID=UPI0039B63CC3
MSTRDLLVMGLYLASLPLLTLWMAGRQKTARSYLGGGHDLPWWGICLSLVATETSTLTVVSVPGVAFRHGMVFVGLAAGYLLGRCLVAWLLLPRYVAGHMHTPYQFLGQRFGATVQRAVSLTFLVTRVIGEAVRLLAGTLPLAMLLAAFHLPHGPLAIMGALMALTLLYTVFGGLKAVIWSDVIQFCTYLLGAILCAAILWHGLPPGTVAGLARAGRFHLFDHGTALLADPFAPASALAGGAVLAMASHGTDHLMVQRLLAARSLRDARLALVASALVVGLLFAALSLLGILLSAAPAAGPSPYPSLRGDDIFPYYIVHGAPAGLSGLLVAGILSATMGSLSSTLNALTSAAMTDFPAQCRRVARATGLGDLSLARWLTCAWAALLIAVAQSFGQGATSLVVFGLSVGAYAYGPMLGAFLFGLFAPRADGRAVLAAYGATLAAMGLVELWVRPGGHALAFTWIVPLGVVLFSGFGLLASGCRRFRRAVT